jgi:DNA polymerase-3 subunit epsilon
MDNSNDTPPGTETAVAAAIGLFFDTETTGLPLWNQPSEDPGQPHIVQLAAKLVNLETREVLKSMDVLVKPEGWSWDDSAASEDKAFQAHRITMERATAEGIPEAEAITQFLAMVDEAGEVIGHNVSFDKRMARIAIKRYLEITGPDEPSPIADGFKDKPDFCTMWKSKPICRLPGNKLPKLTEAFLHFTGKAMEGAHSADGDVDGCIAVYFGIKELERPALLAA